ncbi:MAG: hypothetical protein E7103_08810 [Prevotella sp.]|nr:hypothetical protein [Prevotella sp.]
MNSNQTINSFSARTVGRLMSARRATLKMLATFLIAMTAQTAWAQDPATIGSISYNETLEAYEINSVDNLNDLAVYVNGSGTYSTGVGETTSHTCERLTFKMTADIKYDGSPNNFTPIGEQNKDFYGTFDGQGHTISGIRINEPGGNYKGIFGALGTTTAGVVKNLVVRNCSIVACHHVGVIAGCLTGGQDGTGIIENCHVGSDVTLSGNSYVGGIAGISYKGRIVGCTCAATITGTNSGGNNATKLGGITGRTHSSDPSTLTNNLFTGAITGVLNNYIGAIVGEKQSGDLKNNVYTSTEFKGIGKGNSIEGDDVDGETKHAYSITEGAYVTVDFAGSTTTPYGPNGISVHAAGMKYASTLYFSSSSVDLLLSKKTDYPLLSYSATTGTLSGTAPTGNKDAYTLTMAEPASTITANIAFWGEENGADGSSEEKAYVITGTEGLDLLAQEVNAGTSYEGKYFKLGADIEYNKNTANNFTLIGYRKIIDENNPPIERPFRGHFDGNGKTISGININNSDVNDHGIFGYFYGTVKNLVVSNCSIVADHNIGAIVGVLYGTIENCHVGSDVTLSGHSHVGGIAGWCATATIKGCTSAATITGTNSSDDNANNLGGIVGATNGPSSSLTDNLFTGAITGDLGQYIGAIFGWGNEYATLTNNVYTSAGFGGIGAEGSATGADGAGARKAVAIGAAEGVTITPTGKATTYNVSGITTYADNNVLGYDSKLYAGATDAVKLSIVNTGTPETGYEFSGFTAGEGVTITSSENVYTLTVPASDVTVDVVNQAIIYNITYKGVEDEGVTFTEDNPEAYTVADESFALNNPSREGYLFMGWTYEGQDEPTKTVTIAMGSTGDKTFTANWEEFVETEVETAVTNEAAKEVEITKVMVPNSETKAVIPATVNGYTVTNIAKGAFADVTGEDHVQDIFLPDTKRLINIEEGALIIDKLMEPTLHVPLELLSDYANMPGLKLFFEADKIQAMAVAPNKFWTFSCGIDVKVPKGVKVYTCRMNDDKTAVLIHELTDDELGGVIKANNGVLLSSARGAHPFIVNHATATEVGKSYENNLLEPVLRAKNYASGKYYVLKDNEFHPIIKNDSEVPACKAVLHWASSAKARLEIIVGDDVKTAINGIAADEEGGEWYTISGQRIDKPTKKGLYIKNGKKVIIK